MCSFWERQDNAYNCSVTETVVKHQSKLCINTPILTNFSGHGKSNSFTIPKSSPVTMLRPEWDTQAQVTSALSVLRDQIPTTSSPRTLNTQRGVRSACLDTLTSQTRSCQRPSPCPGGPGNPVNVGLLRDLLPRRHFVHQSFISTCWYLPQGKGG